MSGFFAGMGALLNDIHGAPVLVTPSGGDQVEVRAVFREEPTPIVMENGVEQITVIPMLRGPKDVIGGLVADDLVEPGNGKIYRVAGSMQTKNPAPDSHVIFKLEKINVAPAA